MILMIISIGDVEKSDKMIQIEYMRFGELKGGW
jgi:hypothetical protein